MWEYGALVKEILDMHDVCSMRLIFFFFLPPLATLFERVVDGEGTSHPLQLTPEMIKTMRQLAITEVRHETTEREAAINVVYKCELEVSHCLEKWRLNTL